MFSRIDDYTCFWDSSITNDDQGSGGAVKGLRSCGAVLLVLFLGFLAVAALIAAGWGVIVFIERGAGAHLQDEPTPTYQPDEEAPDPMRPSSFGFLKETTVA